MEKPIERKRIEGDRCPVCGRFNGDGRKCRYCKAEEDGYYGMQPTKREG